VDGRHIIYGLLECWLTFNSVQVTIQLPFLTGKRSYLHKRPFHLQMKLHTKCQLQHSPSSTSTLRSVLGSFPNLSQDGTWSSWVFPELSNARVILRVSQKLMFWYRVLPHFWRFVMFKIGEIKGMRLTRAKSQLCKNEFRGKHLKAQRALKYSWILVVSCMTSSVCCALLSQESISVVNRYGVQYICGAWIWVSWMFMSRPDSET
jgi:hypothetical protein